MANLDDGPKHGWGNGALTPEDAERFAQLFRPSWELDDAPFAAASPDDTIADTDIRALEKGGANPDVQSTLANGTLLMPPPKADPAARSAVAQRAVLNATMPLAQAIPARAPPAPSAAPPVRASAAPASRPVTHSAASTRGHGVNVAGARPRRDAYATGDLIVPRKSKTGLVAGISVAALVAVGGIGALVMMSSGSKQESPAAAPPEATVSKIESRVVPPPPPAPEPPPATTTAAAVATHAPPPPPEPPATTAKPAAPTTPPPPPVAAAPPRPTPPRNTGGGATSKPKSGGGGQIVHDVPF